MNKQEQFEEGRFLTQKEVAQIEVRKQTAILAALGTPGTDTKHLRLSIDFHITITGTPPDNDGMNEPDPVYHAQQARLLAAVKNNPTVLKQWMDSLIVSQMQQKSYSYWEMLTGGDIAFQGMLAPALAALPKEDQEYFADVAKDIYFEDMINLFSASFSVREDAPVIQEDEDQLSKEKDEERSVSQRL